MIWKLTKHKPISNFSGVELRKKKENEGDFNLRVASPRFSCLGFRENGKASEPARKRTKTKARELLVGYGDWWVNALYKRYINKSAEGIQMKLSTTCEAKQREDDSLHPTIWDLLVSQGWMVFFWWFDLKQAILRVSSASWKFCKLASSTLFLSGLLKTVCCFCFRKRPLCVVWNGTTLVKDDASSKSFLGFSSIWGWFCPLQKLSIYHSDLAKYLFHCNIENLLYL